MKLWFPMQNWQELIHATGKKCQSSKNQLFVSVWDTARTATIWNRKLGGQWLSDSILPLLSLTDNLGAILHPNPLIKESFCYNVWFDSLEWLIQAYLHGMWHIAEVLVDRCFWANGGGQMAFWLLQTLGDVSFICFPLPILEGLHTESWSWKGP